MAAKKKKSNYQLVIVESPGKVKTIQNFLGPSFVVEASVGHVRDLVDKPPAGVRQAVPGVEIENGSFDLTYEVDKKKEKVVANLKRLAKGASEIWFATDLDREGEAIAWHLAELIGVDPRQAKRVTFDAITKQAVTRAFENPRPIDMLLVNAQQARRALDKIVGYIVSPIVWKNVAYGLSAGRVQSVALRFVAEREQEIRGFTPGETWQVSASLTLDTAESSQLASDWAAFLDRRDANGKPPLVRDRMAWRAQRRGFACDLVEVGGTPLQITAGKTSTTDLTEAAVTAAQAAGLTKVEIVRETDTDGKGRACNRVAIHGTPDAAARYRVATFETSQTTSKPRPPLITSTLQQAASSTLGMSTDRVMRISQQLYEGIDLPDVGHVGLITYMRTDSTNLSPEAVEQARSYLRERLGEQYVPEQPRIYTSSNSSAQEAHEAIRPTDPAMEPDRIASSLSDDQYRVYKLIWQSFLACQATDAQWDSTTVKLQRSDVDTGAVFRTRGRVLKFDGFYAISGVPTADSNQVLPALREGDELGAFAIDPQQTFESPPPRYSEATLVKKMEQEGVGRPSTYASTINTIEKRNYIYQELRRLFATSLGMRVTEFLKQGYPGQFIEIGYTRDIESELDDVARGQKQWKDVVRAFYEKIVFVPAPEPPRTEPSKFACPQCGRQLVYRWSRKGEFLSCSGFDEKVAVVAKATGSVKDNGKKRKKPKKPVAEPVCSFAIPIDLQRRPLLPEKINLLSPKGGPMVKKTGRFGDFLTEDGPPPPKKSDRKAAGSDAPAPFILNIDSKGNIKFPAPPPVVTDLPCEKCGEVMNLRDGKRGPWLGCRAFPKCRGRTSFASLPEETQSRLREQLETHLQTQPALKIVRLDGTTPVEDGTPLAELSIPGGIAELQLFEHPFREAAEPVVPPDRDQLADELARDEPTLSIPFEFTT